MRTNRVVGPRSPNWALLSRTDIPPRTGEGVYLRRLRIVQTPWFGVMLHRIYLPDTDNDPHDHPWVFWSLVLKGGYDEALFRLRKGSGRAWFIGIKIHDRWSLHRMGKTNAHRILSVRPGTVTLVFHGRRQSSWGFYTPHGYVDWKDYV